MLEVQRATITYRYSELAVLMEVTDHAIGEERLVSMTTDQLNSLYEDFIQAVMIAKQESN